ncbi:MAG: SRPBCC family protein [Chitinophagaceae bacterium]|nr:SRPBCC family protein [Chitinophagaceae bacterium]MCA6453306.1 SRPBCC family protein [Chitinophagaceae bacterium]MCA6455653.1 SRPBCC family protein [Chitinophagaceae bacterium]MCA6457519.1 SRPBCC family protein [Chitinophagaceae bacterium]MCA6463233.1 SRPBCC family protein [Chitinophagaceae bacterium]
MAKQYVFITRWQIKAPLHQVWNAIEDSLNWPNWWKGVVAVKELDKGDAEGLGGVRCYTWRSVLPYRLAFHMQLTELEKYRRLKGIATGELEGEGEWLFEEQNGITYIHYHWTVFTNKSWMNHWAFLLRPAFSYNHDVVMRWGAKGLARKLKAELVSYQ